MRSFLNTTSASCLGAVKHERRGLSAQHTGSRLLGRRTTVAERLSDQFNLTSTNLGVPPSDFSESVRPSLDKVCNKLPRTPLMECSDLLLMFCYGCKSVLKVAVGLNDINSVVTSGWIERDFDSGVVCCFGCK